MRSWLRGELATVRDDLAGAYLFGSGLNPTGRPRDIDVVVVSVDGAGSAGWSYLRAWRDEIVAHFEAAFGIPLSAMVVTPSEWVEIDGVVVRERESLLSVDHPAVLGSRLQPELVPALEAMRTNGRHG